jgi:hypothetical protein
MARWTGCFGSRKRERGARPRCEGPISEGEPVHGSPTSSVAAEWQLSGLPPGAPPASGQQPSGLVIHARRAGDVAPMPQPNSAA